MFAKTLPQLGARGRPQGPRAVRGHPGEKTTLYSRLQHLHQHHGSELDGPIMNQLPSIEVHDPLPNNNKVCALEVLSDSIYTLEEREAAIKTVLSSYSRKMRHRAKHHLGYPLNQDLDYKPLEKLMEFSINNLGDPFIESNYGVHSREFEVGVLNWFAQLWEIEKEDYWGYITTCGTEGNLHGIYVGRENLPDGILYASRDSHYSVFKAARMYRMDTVKVQSQDTGIIDYEDLRMNLIKNKHRPAILNLNIGTTVKGAVDDLDKVLSILRETGFGEDRFYIHCDGALFGIMMSFLKDASALSFKKPIGSISVSGHKFIGAPTPCGISMTRMKHVMALSSDVEYLNSRDATIMGSRNGQAPIQLWYTLMRKGYKGLQRDVEKCMQNAQVLTDMLRAAGFKAMLNDLSNTVVFERPKDEAFVRKWQLACEGEIAHAIVMPNHTLAKLEEFVQDYVRSCSRVTLANNAVPVFVESLAPEGYMELEDFMPSNSANSLPAILH